jgi:bisphosphoglycerate-independent phosphoglycerate mutase (AlkP superfamily)
MRDPNYEVALHQIDALRDALVRVLDTHEKEAKAYASWRNAMENYSDGGVHESRRHTEAMVAASEAEKEARTLLATLKDLRKEAGNG